MFLLQRTRRPTPHVTVYIGRHEVVFTRVTLRDGTSAMMAEVSPEVAEVAEQFGALFTHVDGDPTAKRVVRVELASEPLRATDAPPETLGGEYPPPVAAALRNGWSYDDLTGAGQGDDWGPGGGTNVRTGLTIAEMANCRPPEGWSEKHADGYPWEFVGWKAPGVDWKPPAGGIKRQPEATPAPVIAADPEPTAAPVDDVLAPPVDPSDRTEPPPVMVDPEVALEGISADEREAAITVLTDIWRASGKPPTRSKLNAHLKKAGHPMIKSEDAFKALVDLAPL